MQGHRDCLELLECCPLRRCGRRLIDAEELAGPQPPVTRGSTGGPRCPVCGDDFAPEEPTVACARDHIAVHVDCHLEGLVRRCPAIGCERALEPRRDSPESRGRRVVVTAEALDRAARQSSPADSDAIFVDARSRVTVGPLRTPEQRRERRRRLRAERAARIAEDAERGRALLERIRFEGEEVERRRGPWIHPDHWLWPVFLGLGGVVVVSLVALVSVALELKGLPLVGVFAVAFFASQQLVAFLERRLRRPPPTTPSDPDFAEG